MTVTGVGQPGCQAVLGRAPSLWVQCSVHESDGFTTRGAFCLGDSFRSATRFSFFIENSERKYSFLRSIFVRNSSEKLGNFACIPF